MVKITANELRPGNVIEHKNRFWTIVKMQHVKPGKGGAFMQVELKELKTGTKLNERFRSDEHLERAHTEERAHQFLYKNENALTFMNTQTYDQLELSEELLGDAAPFLQESMEVTISFCDDKAISINLPKTVTLQVVEADPFVKGQTATSSFKPAKLANGCKIMVPQYVEKDTDVMVNTEDGTYVGRAK